MKIICVAKNYVEHIKELNFGQDIPQEPLIFLKPDTALLRNNEPFYIPDFGSEIHYETELVVKINRVTKAIEEKFAHRCYDEVSLGIDFTARDLQKKAAATGMPWDLSKGFDHSAVLAPKFLSLSEMGKKIEDLRFQMTLNGEVKQVGDPNLMIFNVDKIISYVSQFMTLKIGDLIYTGTPVGVGAVSCGDRLVAQLEGETLLDFDIK